MKFKMFSFKDVCEKITDGTHHSPPISKDGIPYITAKHIKIHGIRFFDDPWFVSETDHNKIYTRCDPKPGDVLYIKDGATTGIAAVNEYDFPFSMLSSVALLRPKSNHCIPKYLARWLNSPIAKEKHLRRMGGAAIKRLTLSKIKEFKIPLPPLPEQKRIAAILDAADALRAKRRESIAQLDALVQSTFLEMFGDPVTNPKNWKIQALGKICDVRDGTHDSPKHVDEGYPLLTSKNFKNGKIDFAGANLISEKDFQNINKRSKVDVGDLVMPMIGTIGNPVLIIEEPIFAIKNVALIKPLNDSPNNRFLCELLYSHYFDFISTKSNRGGTQKFVALKDLRAMPIPVPPFNLQNRFATIVQSIETQKSRLRAHLAELDTLFASLQSRAFNGEL